MIVVYSVSRQGNCARAQINMVTTMTLREILKTARDEHGITFGYGDLFIGIGRMSLEHLDILVQNGAPIVFVEKERPGASEPIDLDTL